MRFHPFAVFDDIVEAISEGIGAELLVGFAAGHGAAGFEEMVLLEEELHGLALQPGGGAALLKCQYLAPFFLKIPNMFSTFANLLLRISVRFGTSVIHGVITELVTLFKDGMLPFGSIGRVSGITGIDQKGSNTPEFIQDGERFLDVRGVRIIESEAEGGLLAFEPATYPDVHLTLL